MPHERNTDPLVESRKKLAEEKYIKLKSCLDDMLRLKLPITVAEVVKFSGLSKSYLYQNETAKKLFKEAQQIAKNNYKNISPCSSLDYDNEDLSDVMLQLEDLKRKLHESYILQYQLLSAENERLRKEIDDTKAKIEHLKTRPEITVHITSKNPDKIIYFSLEVVNSGNIYNPMLSETYTLEGFTWGKYIFSCEMALFTLETKIDGISLSEQDGEFILTIEDSVLENCTIEMTAEKLP